MGPEWLALAEADLKKGGPLPRRRVGIFLASQSSTASRRKVGAMVSHNDIDMGAGDGGETHQHIPVDSAHDADSHLTTNQGIREFDNQNHAGARPRMKSDLALQRFTDAVGSDPKE